MKFTLDDKSCEISFDRSQVTATEIINRLLPHYKARDFALKEPDITDIIRSIYDKADEYQEMKVEAEKDNGNGGSNDKEEENEKEAVTA